MGVWDTTALPDCCHTLRLVVTDSAIVDCNGAINNQSETLVSVDVGCEGGCTGDVNADGQVDINDLLLMFANWGICP